MEHPLISREYVITIRKMGNGGHLALLWDFG